ncbi:MAG TPA: UDP-3-O-(3-hydroxymyristoyl)glucosamine N-acyltransferase [Caulobacteraceae bacterium]|nr:UDP-3-O-(3-hydroxymyristoyl)glucosamine N-acyltransferase [Caulobacteraceae bacterium]
MPDSRFFEELGPVSLVELAAIAGASLVKADDGERRIGQVAPLIRGDAASVSFFSDKRYAEDLKTTQSGACFLPQDYVQLAPASCALLITPEPQGAYAKAADRLHRPRRLTAQDTAVHPTAELEEDVVLAPGVLVGAGAKIGRGTSIGAYTVIGPGCAIGRGCLIGSHATIGFALIGDRVRILSGAVIGEPGFGVGAADGKTVDIPQLGRVIIQDNVSIGSCSCIDRGAWDDTVIGENTKIDNLVQIGHNVRLGRGCVLAGMTGISGSCTVGDGVAFGGGAGIADHITIGDRARVAAHAGVMRDIPADEMWVGAPARPVRKFMREMAWLAKMANARGGTDK